jgi:hypothetical protein
VSGASRPAALGAETRWQHRAYDPARRSPRPIVSVSGSAYELRLRPRAAAPHVKQLRRPMAAEPLRHANQRRCDSSVACSFWAIREELTSAPAVRPGRLARI